MKWIQEWRALSDRIEGLLQAVSFFASTYDAMGRNDHSDTPRARPRRPIVGRPLA